MGNEDLTGTAIVIGADDAAGFELANEFGGTFVADLETVTQHHRRDGSTIGQESDGFVIQRVAVGYGRRDHGNVLRGNVDSGCS